MVWFVLSALVFSEALVCEFGNGSGFMGEEIVVSRVGFLCAFVWG